MAAPRRIKRALISVYDKTGIVDFARALHEEFDIELISTGGTAKVLKDAGLPVTLVEDITGFPEMLDGRVKTLHPKIHAAILADRDNPEHMRQLAEQGIEPIDMVVVNLYPFEQTIAKPGCTFEEAIEMIDIGGPCLLRAAAKNHRHVLVLHDPRDWENVVRWVRDDALTDCGWSSVRRDFAASVFRLVCKYNAAIAHYLRSQDTGLPGSFRALLFHGWGVPRYGENPHQTAEVLVRDSDTPDLPGPHLFHIGRCGASDAVEWSFNNYADASAALELCAELTRAATSLSLGDRPLLGDRPPVGQVTGRRPVPQGDVGVTVSGGPTSAGGPTSGRSSDRSETGPPVGCGGDLTESGGPTSAGGPTSGRSMRKATVDEHFSRRHLPHIEKPEAIYFLTFRTRSGSLSPAERDLALQACRFWHGRKMTLHCVSVMPDHVHLLLTPYEPASGRWVPLGELLKSIKSYSSSQINKLRGKQGPLWLDENFDRLIRNETDFAEKWDYIYHNPVTANLVRRSEDYPWFWHSGLGWGELATDPADRPEVGPPAEVGPPLRSVPDRPEVGPPSAPSTGSVLQSCCFIKHTNACGVAVARPGDETPQGLHNARVAAYRQAYLGDPNAAMGGILAVNFPVDAAFAAVVMETYARFGKPLKDAGHPAAPGGFFVEVWLAPDFTRDAVAVIRGAYDPATAQPEPGEPRLEPTPEAPIPKKDWGQRVRLLAVGDLSVEPDPSELDFKRIAGGVLMQTRDLIGLNEDQWQVVTERAPTEQEMNDLRLAWLICKHTKSNAITICRDGMLLGNGAGQMSRVMSCRIATWLAKENGHEALLKGAVAASDAFFPFRDGPDLLIDAGVTALIQPGGSKRDADTIAACDARGVAMIFTGTRHFRH